MTIAATLGSAPAFAQDEGLFSSANTSGFVDVRASFADGDTSWLDGGVGKLRRGGADSAQFALSEAALIWRPRLSNMFAAHIHVQHAPEQDQAIDLVEGYVDVRSDAAASIRLNGRAGVFFPPGSQEMTDLGWTSAHTITPSAISSWIAEEIRVSGVEVTARRSFGSHRLALTAAAFGGNDPAGTVLAFRGWAMHDYKTGYFSSLPLGEPVPSRSLSAPLQADSSAPFREVDDRVGYYGQAEWNWGDGFSLNLLHYDNAGTRTGVDDGQYAWETRFTKFGGRFDVSADTGFLAEVLAGETKMGPTVPPVLFDAEFFAGYLMLLHDAGLAQLAMRVDAFEIADQSFREIDPQDEIGFALTLSAGRRLARNMIGRIEWLKVEGDRTARPIYGQPPAFNDSLLQFSVRIDY